MTADDKPEFLRILTGLASLKPGKPLTPEGLSLYWLALADWPLDDFRRAATHLACSVEFMPNPFHFDQLRQSAQPTASEAWERVLTAIRSMNQYDPVSLDGRTDQAVRAMGGYSRLAMTQIDEMHFRALEFAQLWADGAQVEEARTALPAGARRAALSAPASIGQLLSRDS